LSDGRDDGDAYDAVYLSPHLDDAALSCGGQIHRRVRHGERVLVVTAFTGDLPPEPLSDGAAKILHYMGLEPEEAMAVRRREDLDACDELGAEVEHWPLLESVFRRGAGGEVFYPTVSSIFADPAPADAAAVAGELEARLRALPAASAVVAPLGVGGHVDHRLLRDAAVRVFGPGIGRYEDFPYVRAFRALSRTLGRRSGWRSESVPLDRTDVDAKIRAVAAYRTQVGPLFRGVRRMPRAVRRYARKVGGERLWFPADAVSGER
jgi:LmbE family N-acetylglucosaminyl deacetylase